METAIHEIAIEKCGFYLPDHARYDYLMKLPESVDIANGVPHQSLGLQPDADDPTRLNAKGVFHDSLGFHPR